MIASIETLIDSYDRRLISRRDLARALLLAAIPATGGAQSAAAAPVASGNTINHVQLQVRDLATSADFYSRLVGARKLRENNSDTWVMGMPETPSSELTLRRSTDRPGVVDHFGIGIRDFDARAAASRMKSALPNAPAEIQAGTIVGLGVRDPDGILVQLIPPADILLQETTAAAILSRCG